VTSIVSSIFSSSLGLDVCRDTDDDSLDGLALSHSDGDLDKDWLEYDVRRISPFAKPSLRVFDVGTGETSTFDWVWGGDESSSFVVIEGLSSKSL
jgi:hypothetical protein